MAKCISVSPLNDVGSIGFLGFCQRESTKNLHHDLKPQSAGIRNATKNLHHRSRSVLGKRFSGYQQSTRTLATKPAHRSTKNLHRPPQKTAESFAEPWVASENQKPSPQKPKLLTIATKLPHRINQRPSPKTPKALTLATKTPHFSYQKPSPCVAGY